MDFLASIFVGKPVNILIFACGFLAICVFIRKVLAKSLLHRSVLIAVFAWVLYAVWEYLVLSQTPEANIRIDLIIIWPIIGLVSIYSVYRSYK